MDRRTTIKWMLAAAAAVPSMQLKIAGERAPDVAADQQG